MRETAKWMTKATASRRTTIAIPTWSMPIDMAEARLPRGALTQLLLYVVMCSVWGSSFFFTAIALREFNPIALPTLRMTLATVVLGVFVVLRRPPAPRQPRIYARFALLGLINIAVPYLLLTRAQVDVPTSISSVLSATTPLFVFLFSWLLFRTERFDGWRFLGLISAFAGIVLLQSGVSLTAARGGAGWPLVIVACSMMFAGGNVLTRRLLADVHPLVIAFAQVGAGAVFLLATALATGELEFGRLEVAPILALLELGVLGSALTYLLFFQFIQIWGSTATSLNTYLQPIVGLTLGVLVLDENVSLVGWMALALILAGTAIFAFRSLVSSRRPSPRLAPSGAGVLP